MSAVKSFRDPAIQSRINFITSLFRPSTPPSLERITSKMRDLSSGIKDVALSQVRISKGVVALLTGPTGLSLASEHIPSFPSFPTRPLLASEHIPSFPSSPFSMPAASEHIPSFPSFPTRPLLASESFPILLRGMGSREAFPRS